MQIDLGAERKARAAVETELVYAKKTVGKLRAKLDNMMVDAVKSSQSVQAMRQKVQLKQHDKEQRFNHSDVVVDRAIAKKGRGRDDHDARRKKRGVTRGDEREARATFARWSKGGEGGESYSDNGDIMGDYDDTDYSSVSSGGKRCYSYKSRGRKSGRSRYRSQSRRRCRSRRSKSSSRRRRSNRRRSSCRQSRSRRYSSTDGSHTTFDPEKDNHSMLEDEHGNRNNMLYSQNDIGIDGDCAAGRAYASQPINVELSIRLSQQSIGADDHVSN